MAQGFSHISALFEAMYLSSATLERIEEQACQQHRQFFVDLQSDLTRFTNALTNLVTLCSGSDIPEAVARKVMPSAALLGELVLALVTKARAMAPSGPDAGLTQAIKDQLSTIENLAERLDNILDGWEDSFDAERCTDLRARLAGLDPKKASISNWREELEFISD